MSRASGRERGIWQRRFWERAIGDDRDFTNHVATIHINPDKRGYAEPAVDWRHSTIHRFIGRGVVDENWAATVGDGEYGEG